MPAATVSVCCGSLKVGLLCVHTQGDTLPVGDVIGRGVPSGMSCSTVVMTSQEVMTSCVGVGDAPVMLYGPDLPIT